MKLSSIDNYSLWETQMLCLLESQELVGFIDDTIPTPNGGTPMTVAVDEDYRRWKRCDRLVKGWILGSLHESVLATVVGLSTARAVWIKLRSTLGPNSQGNREDEEEEEAMAGHDQTRYLPLYKDGLEGDWDKAKIFMDGERGASTAFIALNGDTIIHLAVGTGKAIHFLKRLVEYLPIQDLSLRNNNGDTPLVTAARVGNTEAAKILLGKRRDLLRIMNNELMLPLHVAALSGHRDTLLYFQTVSSADDYAGQAGADHLCWTITHGFIDIALDLISRYPNMGRMERIENFLPDPLSKLAAQVSFFRSGNHLNSQQNLIYTFIPLKFENNSNRQTGGGTDVENQAFNCQVVMTGWVYLLGVCKRLHTMLWDAMELLAPEVKKLRQKKIVHHQAVQLVKRLCEGIRSTNNAGAYVRRTTIPVTLAASLGTFEVVEEIVDILPIAAWSRNDKGAALQMQRELQWFQEVTKLYGRTYNGMKNSDGDSPAMIFTREHKELVVAGEKWMKDTANSCSIAAALIITVVFAAAITVPGGNNGDTGLPIFSNERAFWLFAISDAFSLFTSTTSLFMFLSILTARYAEKDFLHALPKRLILGLLTLFLSIASMIIAFSATVYLVFGQKKGWSIIPVAALSCLPITSFVTLQFPLLIDVLSSTYGRGIFGKQSDRPFH